MPVAAISTPIAPPAKRASTRLRGSGAPVPESVSRAVSEAVEATYRLLDVRPSTSPALSLLDFASANATLEASAELLADFVDTGAASASSRTCSDVLPVLFGLTAAQRRLEEARSQQRLEAVSQVQEALNRLNSIGSVSGLIDRVPEEVCRLGFDRAFISRVHGSTWVPEAVHVAGDPEWAALILQAGRENPQKLTHAVHDTEMVRRRVPLLVSNVQEDERVHQPIACASRSESYVAAPIIPHEGRVIGFIHADRYLQRRHVDESDRDILWMFAQGFAQTFERTVLLERLKGLRSEVARLTDGIAGVMNQFVDAEVEVARIDRKRVEVTRSAAAAYLLDVDEPTSLTRREVEVLRLMGEGETNGAIAARLVISEGTVKSHVKHILRKLGAANRAEAVSLYFRAEHEARARGTVRSGQFGAVQE